MFNWRSYLPEDLPAVLELMHASDLADAIKRLPSLDELKMEYEDPWCNPHADSRLLVTPEGELAAMVRSLTNHQPQPAEEALAFLDIYVHPRWRTPALADDVLAWAEQRTRERLAVRPTPHLLRAGFRDTSTHFLDALARCGFAPVRYFYRMSRDLTQPIPAAPLPAGLELRPYRPEDNATLRATFNATFGDHWGHIDITEDDWNLFYLKNPNIHWELSLLAWAGETLAAHSFNYVFAEDNARRGVKAAQIGQLGTRREFRKQGLASALLCESMRRFRAAGYDTATLGVDAENPTGALGLYEALGFVVNQRSTVMQKELA